METLGPNETEHVFKVDEDNFRVCVRGPRVGSNGLYFDDNPFHYVLPATLFQIIVVLLLSRLLYSILRPLRAPKLICNALGGIILGPSVLGRIAPLKSLVFPPKQAEFLLIGAAVGTIYYIFLISLKMDIITTLKAAKRTWRFGVIPTVFSFLIMTVLIRLYSSHDHDGLKGIQSGSYVFSCALSLSNFAVISDALMELNLITSELGQIALSSAMLNDAILWMNIIASNLLKTKDVQDSIRFLSVFWGLIFFCIFILRPIMVKIAKTTPIGKPLKEVYIVMIHVGVLFMSGVTDFLGLSYHQGPLLLGLIMPNGPPLGTTIIERTENIVSQIFMPLFFACVGLGTDVPKIKDWEMSGELYCVMLAGYMAKVIGCLVVSKTYNIKLRQGLVLGLILNLKGVVELVIIRKMKKVKLLNVETTTHVVLFCLVMTAIISPLIEFLYKPHTRLEKSARHRAQTLQHCPKNSEFCIITCIHNEGNVHGIISLLEAFHPNESSPICIYVTHLIELLGKSTPVLIPFDKKSKSKSANYANTNHIMRAFENYSLNSPGPVIILPYINIAPYKNMHVSICNLIQDKSLPFLIIPFHLDNKTPGGVHVPAIRDLNAKLQACAPCTVGILVDKNSRSKMSASEFCLHVGIFFIGGADDREVLALASRMSEHENVKISLFMFLLKNRHWGIIQDEMAEDKDERMLDENLMDEFRGKNIGNPNVVLREIEVEDGVEVMETIRVLEGNYDLVMVGREHDIGALKDLEMSEFVDNADTLGLFGDMLASNEFCNGMVSVLVMQCGGRRDLERTGSSLSHKTFGFKSVSL